MIKNKLILAALCTSLSLNAVMPVSASVNQTMTQLADDLASDSSENIVLSPYSIRVALSMLTEGANGTTKDELLKFLETYAGKLNDQDDIPFNLANSFWLNKDFQPNSEYTDLLKEEYQALIESLDFESPGASDQINQWVEDQTNGLITDMVDDSISSMEAVLLNALYYQGTWQLPFDDSHITEANFSSPNGPQSVTMLNGESDGWDYYENEQASGFRIFYEDGLQFIGILPNDENFQLADLDIDGLLSSNNDWCTKNISLHYELPEFQTSCDFSLKDALIQAGVQQVFTNQSDLSGIADSLKVDSIIHKTYIDVNRKGTEAAASTSIMLEAMSAPAPETEELIEKEVILDRPFAFVILEPMSQEILFMGKINTIS